MPCLRFISTNLQWFCGYQHQGSKTHPMSTTWRIILLLVIWLLYCLFGLQFCSNLRIHGLQEESVPKPPEDPAFARYPIDFSFSDPTPNINAGFDSVKQSILSEIGGGGDLTITGLYFDEEQAPAGAENMGIARANAVLALLERDLDASRIAIASGILDGEPIREGFFEGVRFSLSDGGSMSLDELADRINFLFPYNSSKAIEDPQMEQYLDELAQNLVQSGGQITVVGHTDSVGSDGFNIRLGRDRALAIYRMLIAKQVPQGQMEIESKGESQPLVPNDSEANRSKNRRVETIADNE